MPAHHKTKLDPHAGPSVGDRSFEYYFVSPMDFHAAMQRAKELEKKGMYRRAWRVRLNLDGPQPVVAPPRPEAVPVELTEKEKKELRRKKKRLNELKLKVDRLTEELEEHNHE
jgi:tetrahydromethanopterin S-methyltransferase subunit G